MIRIAHTPAESVTDSDVPPSLLSKQVNSHHFAGLAPFREPPGLPSAHHLNFGKPLTATDAAQAKHVLNDRLRKLFKLDAKNRWQPSEALPNASDATHTAGKWDKNGVIGFVIFSVIVVLSPMVCVFVLMMWWRAQAKLDVEAVKADEATRKQIDAPEKTPFSHAKSPFSQATTSPALAFFEQLEQDGRSDKLAEQCIYQDIYTPRVPACLFNKDDKDKACSDNSFILDSDS